jgi:glycosyltransferase involved in cell wall biosynthesis
MISNGLGIVVIGRNEGGRLVSCLRSVKEEGDFQTVYVDSGSTDGSVSAAAELGVPVVNLDPARPFSAARARNEGFSALLARRPNLQFVQFIDGDCELVPGWIDKAMGFLSHRNDVAVVCGRRRERHPEASVYNRLCDIEWNTPVGEAIACGGDTMIRSDAFKAAGGFRTELIAGEEPEICLRLRLLGWKIWRLDAEMTRHDAAIMRFSQWWRRIMRSGYAYAEIARLHRNSKIRIYTEEAKRAVLWGGILPLVILISMAIHPVSAAGFLLYPIQIARIALRQKGERPTAWAYATFIVIAKFAEFQGLLKFYISRLVSGPSALIEYK